MAVAFRAAGALAKTNTGAGGIAVPYPAGIAAGDLLVMQVSHATAITLNLPSGWTNLFGPVAGSGASAQSQHVLYKVATGSESGTLTVTTSGSNTLSAIMSAYSGCNTTTPVDVYATASLPTSGTSGTAPSVTTTKPNTLLLHMFWDWSGTGTITPNAADTERYDTFDNLQNYITELADKPQAATGATGTSAVTYSTGTSGGLAATIALAPAATVLTPVANFTATPLSGPHPLTVSFTDASTNTPTSWAWTFGDGGTSTSQNPAHTYTAAGTYDVTLTATNTAGSDGETKTGYVAVDAAVGRFSRIVVGPGLTGTDLGGGAIEISRFPAGNTYTDVLAAYGTYAALLAG